MKRLLIFSMLLCLLWGCRKDSEETIISEEIVDAPIVVVTSTLLGTVVDEDNQPLADVQAFFDGDVYTTNEDGVFLIKDGEFITSGSYVRLHKDGYFHNSARIYASNNSRNYVRFKMIRANEVGSVDAQTGGQVDLPGGGSIQLAGDGFQTDDGTAYAGRVSVAATWLNPTAEDLDERMPGDLLGRNTDGALQVLESFGMLGVELTGDNGERLQLGNDKMATLRFPVPAEMAGIAPAEIPLWHFDEDKGLWVEEGSASLDGDFYVGSVSHFSFWNCDAPFPVVQFCATLTTRNTSVAGDSLEGFKVHLVRPNGTARCGYTDSNGKVCGKVPKGEVLQLELRDECGNTYFSQTIGPFDDDTDIGVIVVDDSPGATFTTISGRLVDCNNDPITSGVAFVRVAGARYDYYLDADNSFSVLVRVCQDDTPVTVQAANLDNLEASDLQSYTLDVGDGDLSVGDLIICGGTLAEFLYLDLDGNTILTNSVFMRTFSGGSEVVFFAEGGALDSTSNRSIYTSFEVSGAATGEYGGVDGNTLQIISMTNLAGTANLFSNCDSSQISCFYDQLTITEYGAIGELIKGNFSGTVGYFDGMGNILSDRPVSGSFSIIRTD